MRPVTVGIRLLLLAYGLHKMSAFGQEATSTATVSENKLSPEVRGDILLFRREYQAAIAAYSSSPEQSAAILNKTGVAYHHLYAFDKAKTAYERALRLKPDFPDALNNLGAIYFQGGDLKKAEQLYRRALKLEPASVTAAKNLGSAYFAQGNLRKGTEAYRIALRGDPNAFSGSDDEEVIGKPATSKDRSKQDYCLAALFAHAGMNDRAVEFLRRALDAGFDDYKRLSGDPDFANLRNTPEFAQLMNEQRRQ